MKLNTYEQRDYSGGLNDTASSREIDSNEATLLRNWNITNAGQLIRRAGLTQSGDTQSANISGLHAYLQTDGDEDVILMEGANMRYLNSTTFDALDSGFTSGNDFTLADCPINNKMYVCNEDNTQHSWDRAATTLNSCLTDLGATVPHGNVMRWHKNHMFMVNNVTVSGTAYPNRLYWSAMGDPDTYDTTNDYIDMPGNGRIITMMDLGDSLMILKERGIQYLDGWGDTDWRITATASNVSNLDEQVGTLSPKGAVRVGNEVWFMDEDANIRRVNRTDFDAFRSDIISTKIQTILGTINASYLHKVVAWSHGEKVYFSIPTGTSTENDTVLVFDLITAKRTGSEAWTTYTGWSADFFMSFPSNGISTLFMADAGGKKVYSHEGDDDDGTAIDARWDSKIYSWDYPERYKRTRFGYATGSGTSGSKIGFFVGIDGGSPNLMGYLEPASSGSNLGTTGTDTLGPTGDFTLGSGSDTEFKFFPAKSGVTGRGKLVQMSVRHNEANKDVTINSYTIHYKLRSLR